METARQIMGEARGQGGAAATELIAAYGAAIARVCMALLGDAKEVERVLEQIAHDAATREPPEPAQARGWIFGLARAACAARLSRIPLRTTNLTGPHRPRDPDDADAPPPNTERLGAREAVPARARLAQLRPTEREAVVLSAVGGLDAEDVAVACGVDVATARARIAAGMTKLLEADR